MPELTLSTLIAGLAALVATLGSLAWIVGAVLGMKVLRVVQPLADAPADATPTGSLRVVVPARDEAGTLPAAAATLLAQEHPALELVFVDDRSTDGTAALLDELATQDERARVIHVEELPDGWLGKTHALSAGARDATTDWLLFTDADVHFAPGCLARATAWAEERQLDHLVLMPDIPSEGFMLDATVAAFGRSFVLGQRLWAVEDPNSDAFVGVGAFNLVRRTAFERTPGLPWLALDVVDDVALGKMMKQSGARCGIGLGRGLLSVRWYTTLGGMVRGLEKNTFAVAGFSLPRTLLMAGLLLAMDAAPLLALLDLGLPAPVVLGLRILGGSALLSGVIMGVVLARWGRRPVWPGLAFPVGTLMMAFILVRAGVLGALRGGIAWRGTYHSSESLRESARVRFL